VEFSGKGGNEMFLKKIGIVAVILCVSIASLVAQTTLVVGQATDPIILDPPMYSDTPTHNVNLLIYDRLYDLSSDGKVVPGLAVDLPKIEENGTKYTIKIKKRCKIPQWSAADNRRRDLFFPARRIQRQIADEIHLCYDVRRKKIDTYTFQFRTGFFDKAKTPTNVQDSDLKSFEERAKYYKPAAFGSQLNQLTWLGASIVSKATLEKAQQDGTLRDYGITWAVGSGPFKFDSWKQGDSITLVRNKGYHDATIQTNVEKIVFKTIRDPSALKSAFLNKEVDLIMNVVPLDAREIEQVGGKILLTDGYFGYHYLGFNMKSPRVGQVNPDGTPDMDGEYDLSSPSAKLRFAILYSINPADIVNSPDILDRRGKVTLQYVESLPFGHIDDPKGTRIEEGNLKTGYYNPTKAKELFASLPSSLKKPGLLKCTALSGSVFVKEALVIKDQVKRVLGVDLITIEQVALSELATRRSKADPDVWDLIVNWTQTDDSYYIFVAFRRDSIHRCSTIPNSIRRLHRSGSIEATRCRTALSGISPIRTPRKRSLK